MKTNKNGKKFKLIKKLSYQACAGK